MAVFAIKGAINSIITGYKEEEEVEYLHSSWYIEAEKRGKKFSIIVIYST